MRLLVLGRTGRVTAGIRRRAPPGVVVAALRREAADLLNPSACARRCGSSAALLDAERLPLARG